MPVLTNVFCKRTCVRKPVVVYLMEIPQQQIQVHFWRVVQNQELDGFTSVIRV